MFELRVRGRFDRDSQDWVNQASAGRLLFQKVIRKDAGQSGASPPRRQGAASIGSHGGKRRQQDRAYTKGASACITCRTSQSSLLTGRQGGDERRGNGRTPRQRTGQRSAVRWRRSEGRRPGTWRRRATGGRTEGQVVRTESDRVRWGRTEEVPRSMRFETH